MSARVVTAATSPPLQEGHERAPTIPSITVYNGLLKAYREVAMSADPEDVRPPVRLLAFSETSAPRLLEAQTPQEILSASLPVISHLRRILGSERGPNSITYNVLMDFAAELGDLTALEAVMAERASAGLRTDHYVVHSLMKCHAVRGNLTGVTEVKDMMDRLRVVPSERTFSVLVLSLLRCGETHKAELLLRNALTRSLYIHDSLFMAFLQHYAKRNDLESARQVFRAYSNRFRRRTVPVWNAYLAALAAMGQVRLRLRQDSRDRVMVLGQADRSLSWCIDTACGGTPKCVILRAEPLACIPVYPCCSLQVALAEGAFEEMIREELRPTARTYAQLVRASCVGRDLPNALSWLGMMRSRRFSPDIFVYNWVIYACLEAGQTESLAEVLRAMEREGVQPNLVTNRARDQIMRVLASRMRDASQTVLSRLSISLNRKEGQS